MGNKVSPVGFRIGFLKPWGSCWFADEIGYDSLFLEDYKIKEVIKKQLMVFNIEKIIIERILNSVTVYIYCCDPGIVIGKDGERIKSLNSLLVNVFKKVMQINVCKTRNKNLSAANIVSFIKEKIRDRIPYKRAIKQAMNMAVDSHAAGIKVIISGRIGGAEIARSEKFTHGRVPTHTLRASIDYCFGPAETVYGTLGIKVWIYKEELYKYDYPLLVVPQESQQKNEKKNSWKGNLHRKK
jgi:small subunit ribosomal protein S3